uniref:Protein kinase domain-containing protein n=1 Tax=Phaeomonas parva TaxID=124430 RepID=A0A6U4GEK2_9STRA|mmetsp:Transcript_28963/g.92601  ORF Transcript_28963/g.92601 Transcript_28963/m.92601 type:complete len:538 (+) Transcript_28963:1162-2775(+)
MAMALPAGAAGQGPTTPKPRGGLRIMIPEVTTLNMGCSTPDGRFHVKRRIGSGLEAEVYVVEALARNGAVVSGELALKVLKAPYWKSFAELQQRCAETRHANVLRARPLPAEKAPCLPCALAEGAALQAFDLDGVEGADCVDADAHTSMIASELCAEDLLQRVRCAPGGCLPEERVCGLAADIAAGLAHCHSRHWYHLDVKPENILLKHDGTAVLADFGCAVKLKAAPGAGDAAPGSMAGCSGCENIRSPRRPQGSTPYLPEECFSKTGSPYIVPLRSDGAPPQSGLAQSFSAMDSWGLGVTLFAALTGRRPWDHAKPEDRNYANYRDLRLRSDRQVARRDADAVAVRAAERAELVELLQWPASISEKMHTLLLNLMHPLVTKRWSPNQALAHLRCEDLLDLDERSVSPVRQLSPGKRAKIPDFALPPGPPSGSSSPVAAGAGDNATPCFSLRMSKKRRLGSGATAADISISPRGRRGLRRPPASIRQILRAAPVKLERSQRLKDGARPAAPVVYRLVKPSKAGYALSRKRKLEPLP